MIDLEFKTTGLAELNRTLQQIPVRVERNILRGMIRAAAKPVAADARARAPRLAEADPRRIPGALAASIRVMSVMARGARVLGGVVAGASRKTRKTAADAFYAKWVEYGRAGMAAQPYLRPAADTQAQAAIAAAADYVRERLAAGDLVK